ncbi:MAG: DUF3857 domain-containing protein [Acidobacteria bacterium]|nr:DUF3857 domain-containing protein [Acidobacteriota bacterium]
MSSDPKAPGADAVYLFREETTDDNLHYHAINARIKVLTEKGKELATVRIPYERHSFKVTDIKGRTIHADGTIIPLTTKPSDLMEVKTKDLQINTMVFTLPSVEVGSVLEYKLLLRYDDNVVSSPDWDIQQQYFVHKAHYAFLPARDNGYVITNSRGEALNRLMYSSTGGIGDRITHKISGGYELDLMDIPAIPSEDWMPPQNSVNWRMQFYYTQYSSGGEFWQKEGNRWQKEADHFADPSKTLRDAVAQIVAPSDTEDQKSRKIYAEVMKLENTDFTREKSKAELKNEKLKQIKSAEDVWKQKGGTSDEIALLYIALARAAGLHVFPMQVVNRSRAMFDPTLLSTSQLDDYIAVVTIAGKEVYLDPGQKMCPYGVLHWKHMLAEGFRESDKGMAAGSAPGAAYTTNVTNRIADLTIDPSGNVKGTIRYIMRGQQALHWRQLTLRNDEDEVKKRFNELIRSDLPQGVEADFNHFLGLSDYESNLMAMVDVSGTLANVTGKRLIMPELFFASHARHPFLAQDKRTTGIDVHFAQLNQDEVTYHIPAEFTMDAAPAPASIGWANHAAFKSSSTVKGSDIVTTRTVGYNFTLLEPKEYGDLHDFYQKVAAADQQQLVLTRSQVAKGN